MRNLRSVQFAFLALLLPTVPYAAPPTSCTTIFPAGTDAIHDTAYITSGELLMMVNNRGAIGHDVTAHFGMPDGLHYPGHCTTTVMYTSGLWLGAKVNGQVRVSTAEYTFDYLPGTIVGGVASPDDPRFRVYKIRSGDTKFSNLDYAEWPFDDGAPALKDSQGNDSLDSDGDRIPRLLADEAIWTVFNDADVSGHSSFPGGGDAGPLGIEVQLYAYAFDSSGDVGRIIFMNYTLINKGGMTLDSTHLSFWADPDLGDAGDDLVGCDTLLDLGYCYNAGSDAVYGTHVPAIGVGVLNGPIVPSNGDIAWKPASGQWLTDHRNLAMTAFSRYINGTDPGIAQESWNYMRGLNINGTPLTNPQGGAITKFAVSGNPVTATGWLDNNPGDRRFMVTSGPFTMMPGDAQEVALAMMVGSSFSFDCHIGIFTDTIHAEHVAGTSGGRAFALLGSPDSTTGHDYEITFSGTVDDIRWHVADVTLGLTLVADYPNIRGIGAYPYIDGMLVKVIGYPPGMGGWDVPNGTLQFTSAGIAQTLMLEGFGGVMGWNSPCHLFGVCDEQGVPASGLRRVLLKLADTDANGNFDTNDEYVSYAYRYLRAAGPPARPEFEPYVINPTENYGFQDFTKSVPLSAWDLDANPPRRLAIGHLENNVAGGAVDGRYWPPFYLDADNIVGGGPREWLFIFNVDYAETSEAGLSVSALTNQLPVMYMSHAARRTDIGWETGDEFLIIPVDSNLYFSDADVFTFTSPPPSLGLAGTMDRLQSITNLRLLDSIAQAKFEELHWTCACPCLADPACMGGSENEINIMDIVGFIDVAFRGVPAVSDRPCPSERTDVNCDELTDIRDVVTVIDVAFRNADPSTRFCNPCEQP